MSANQCAAGDGVFSLGSGVLFDAVVGLSNVEAPVALDQLSGEIHVSAQTALIDDSRFARETAINRLRGAFGSAGGPQGSSETGFAEGTTIWGQGFGSWGRWNGDGNAATMDRDIGGFFLGADALATDDARLGLMAGYQSSRFDVDDRASSGKADSWTVGAYGGATFNGFALRGGAAYSGHAIDIDRSVAFTGFSDQVSASYDARTAQVFGEVAHGFAADSVRFEPFANVAYVNLRTDAFAEDGGAAALTAGAQTTDATFATLGLRADAAIELGGIAGAVRGTVGYKHAFADTPAATLAFVSGGDAFSIAGVPVAANAFVLDAGLDVNISANATLGLWYGGQFGSGFADQGVSGTFGVKF